MPLVYPFSFRKASGVSYVSTLISRTAGTAIGDMIDSGGLVAAFDGNLAQASGACAENMSFTTHTYVGRTFAAPKRIDKFVVYGATDVGLFNIGDPATTIDLYGKAGAAPANDTNGTLLGTLSFTDTSSQVAWTVTNSGIDYTQYDHGWVRVSSASLAISWCVAEVEMYEWA